MYEKSKVKQLYRSLKVNGKNVQRKKFAHTRYVTVPTILLQGQWLEDAGFRSNDRVLLDVQHQCILIKPQKPGKETYPKKKSA